jgi:hypothetical protein
MPGRSLNGSGKSMLKALLAVCLYVIFKTLVETFLMTKFLLYSVPGVQCLHSSWSEHSSPNLRERDVHHHGRTVVVNEIYSFLTIADVALWKGLRIEQSSL